MGTYELSMDVDEDDSRERGFTNPYDLSKQDLHLKAGTIYSEEEMQGLNNQLFLDP